MSCSGVEHKLRVFISSKCGGKYTIARKALEKLLKVTGLVETYVFETEPASSEDTQSAYLEYVDNSNLCIFLVDNEDGVPPAVLSEEKRAKDRHLRLLYLFCDENQKEPTPMQEEIKSSLSQKYYVVHDFSDIVAKAYDSVMQDIIAVYKRRDEQFSNEKNEGKSEESKSINIETSSVLPMSFSKYPSVVKVLTNHIVPINSFKEESEATPVERLLSEQLQAVVFQKSYDETIINAICAEVLKENGGEISEVLKLRYQAQKNYYLTKYEECLSLLQEAFTNAIEAKSIPTWIANDIAIDIRYLQGCIDEKNSTITLENPGQKLIDTSGEPVYYPYLDRQVENMQKEIANKYYSQLSISPYATSYGGLEQIFSPLANAFCIAEIHGSIVQTEITRDRLISIYSMLCTLYEDHDLIVEYIKYLLTNREEKKLDAVIRTYNQSIDILNGQDIDAILACINNIYDPVHIIMSKYLLVSRLGYYMTDATYSVLYKELVEYAMNWVCDNNRIFSLNKYIFDFFARNTFRVETKDIVDFIYEVFNYGLSRYYMECFKVLRRIDYSNVDQVNQERIKKIFVEVISKEDENLFDQYFTDAILHFCVSTKVPCEDLETIVEEKLPSYYRNTFMMEMSAQRNQDLSEYLRIYLEEAKSSNKTQGIDGTYAEYAYESLDVVYNILKQEETTLNAELLKNIIDVALETLSSERQTIKAKRAAIKLLQLLYFRNDEQEVIWDKISKQMKANIATFSVGYEMGFFSKDTNYILSFQFRLFLHSFYESERDLLLEMLYSTETSESYTIIQFLIIIADYLEIAKDVLKDENLISAFLYYSIFMSQYKEQDVKYHAAICLIQLTNFEKVRRLALMHLSQIMNSGSQAVKIAILSRLSRIQIDEDNSYLKQIINKGKSDSNYLVRYIASREN